MDYKWWFANAFVYFFHFSVREPLWLYNSACWKDSCISVLIDTTCSHMFQMRMRNKLCIFVTWPFDCCRQLLLGRPRWWSYLTTPWSLCPQLHNWPSLEPPCCACQEGWSQLLPPLLWPSQQMELHIRWEPAVKTRMGKKDPQAQQWGFLEPLRCWSFLKLIQSSFPPVLCKTLSFLFCFWFYFSRVCVCG